MERCVQGFIKGHTARRRLKVSGNLWEENYVIFLPFRMMPVTQIETVSPYFAHMNYVRSYFSMFIKTIVVRRKCLFVYILRRVNRCVPAADISYRPINHL